MKRLLVLLLVCGCNQLPDPECRDECRERGACELRDGTWDIPYCAAVSDLDCQVSVDCHYYGRCGWDGDDYCIAVSQHDCLASTACALLGACVFHDQDCFQY